jgi:hypothetical protein
MNIHSLLYHGSLFCQEVAKIAAPVYTLPSLFEGGNTVISRIGKICLALVVALIALCSACLVSQASNSAKSPLISSLEADYMNLDPKAMSEIKCVVSASDNNTVQFTWSSDGGSIIGDGSTVIWQAPNEYGDYHVMVTAKDVNGDSAKAVLTLSVVPRPHKSCCGGRR